MPLKIDRLIASQVETTSVSINGGSVTPQAPTFFGGFVEGAEYVSVGNTDTIVSSFLIPANTYNGSIAIPYFSLLVDFDSTGFTSLTLTTWINETPTLDGAKAINQQTIEYEGNLFRFIDGQLILSEILSGIQPQGFQLKNDKLLVLVLTKNVGDIPGTASVITLDNFDTSKNQYLILTANNDGGTIGVRTLVNIINTFGK